MKLHLASFLIYFIYFDLFDAVSHVPVQPRHFLLDRDLILLLAGWEPTIISDYISKGRVLLCTWRKLASRRVRIKQLKCGKNHLSLSENGGKTLFQRIISHLPILASFLASFFGILFGILFGIVGCWEEDLKDPYNLKSGNFVGVGIWEVFLCALIHDFQEVAWKTVTTFSSA